MRYEIFRYEGGISLNPREYILDDEGNKMLFDSADDALAYVNNIINPPVHDVDELGDEYGIYVALVEEDWCQACEDGTCPELAEEDA